jgi:hypothetical protein
MPENTGPGLDDDHGGGCGGWSQPAAIRSEIVGYRESSTTDSRLVAEYREIPRELPAEGAQTPTGSGWIFSLGATAMQRRVREDLGLDYTLGEVERLASSEIERVSRLIRKEEAGRGTNAPAKSLMVPGKTGGLPGRFLNFTTRKPGVWRKPFKPPKL